jgi:hypothetical protein
VAERDQVVAERDQVVAERDQVVAERDDAAIHLVRTEAARLQTEQVLVELLGSRSWRWTRYLRSS